MNEKKINFEEIWKRIEKVDRTIDERMSKLEEKQRQANKEKQLDKSFQKQVVEFMIGDHRAQKYTMSVLNKMREKQPQIKALQAKFKKDLETVSPENAEAVSQKYREKLADILSKKG